MKNYKRVMVQLNESEHRFYKMENEKKMLHERNDVLFAELQDIKNKMNNRISCDFYLYTLINSILNLFKMIQAAIWGAVCYLS